VESVKYNKGPRDQIGHAALLILVALNRREFYHQIQPATSTTEHVAMKDPWQRLQLVISILGLSWLVMMASHEFGHILAAKLTGGLIVRIVLHPATISRTDVLPNPSPLVVAWAGPVLGCLIPILLALVIRRLESLKTDLHCQSPAEPTQSAPSAQRSVILSLSQFFAGFCCIANGAYLGLGVFDRVGDAGEILNAGTPPWMLFVFGLTAVTSGMALWHRLGSPLAILQDRDELNPWLVRGLMVALLLVIVVECVLSPT
jgi:hypothetical protein